MTHKIRSRLNNLLCLFQQSIVNSHNSLKNVIPGLSVHLMQVLPVERLLALALLFLDNVWVRGCGY